MANKTFAESAQAFAVKQALKMLKQPPEECIPKLIDWAQKFDASGVLTSQIGVDKAEKWAVKSAELWRESSHEI